MHAFEAATVAALVVQLLLNAVATWSLRRLRAHQRLHDRQLAELTGLLMHNRTATTPVEP